MRNKKLIDDAFAAYASDNTNWYEVSNLTDEDLDKEEKQHLFNRICELCTTKKMPYELRDNLRWAVNQKLAVPKNTLDKLADLVLSSEFSTDSYLAGDIAQLFRKETYPENVGEIFHDPEMAKKWISISLNTATSADDYIRIIEDVVGEYSGLRIGDKIWGQELLKQVKSKADDKTYKKVERSVKSLFA